MTSADHSAVVLPPVKRYRGVRQPDSDDVWDRKMMIVFCDDPCHSKKCKVAEFVRHEGLWVRSGVIPLIANDSVYIAVPASSMPPFSRGQAANYSCRWCPGRHRHPCDRRGRQQFSASLHTLQKPLSFFADELGMSEVTVAQVNGVLSNVT